MFGELTEDILQASRRLQRTPSWCSSSSEALCEFHDSAVGTPKTKRTSARSMARNKKTCHVQCVCVCSSSSLHLFCVLVVVCVVLCMCACCCVGARVLDVIVHVFMIPFTNAKSSDSDTHEWINEICFVARAHECHVI